MTLILASVTLFCVVLIVLDRVPERYLTSDLMVVRVSVRPDRLWVMIACEAFLFEWVVNQRGVFRDGAMNGTCFMIGCENWWTRRRGDIIAYRRVVVDSREWSAR